MYESVLTSKAAALARSAHAGQTDKAGKPYFDHVMHVAEAMETEEETCVALLHDTLEDTELTACDLREAGMSEAVVEAVELLTHDPAVDYFDYIRAVRENPLAAKVKKADLDHNADITRLLQVTFTDMKRRSKYIEALAILEGVNNVSYASPGWVGSQGYAVVDNAEAGQQAMPPAPSAPKNLA